MNQPQYPATKLWGGAIFSPCQTYRYLLWRQWADHWFSNYVMFIGLNPSTADATTNDPTLRRCIQFAKDWGYSGLCMGNLFAYRATNPLSMMVANDPIGSDNDIYLVQYASQARLVIAAWGNRGAYNDRDLHVQQMIPNLQCLTLTASGRPAHPLYLPRSLKPIKL